MTKPTLSEHIEKIVEAFDKDFPFEGMQPTTRGEELDPDKVVENGHRQLRNRLKFDTKSFLRTHLTEIAKASEVGTLMAVREILHAIAMQTTSIEALDAIEKAQIAIVGDIVAANKEEKYLR